MICTECSKSVRPIVCLDIDGTLGDYHTHFLRFAEQWFGVKAPMAWYAYNGSEPFREYFCTVFETDVTTFRKVKLAYRAGGQKRTMPVFEGASSLAKSIWQMNCEIWLTTTRPYLRLDGVDEDTREWLNRSGIAYHYLLYDEEKYEVLDRQIDDRRVVAVLDDEPEQLLKAEALWGMGAPILRATPYNAYHQYDHWDGRQADNLHHALELIAKRVYEWRTASNVS